MVTVENILYGGYFWETETPHSDNIETTNDFIANHLPDDIEVYFRNGCYFEIKLEDGSCYSALAFGNGDFCNHQVEFEPLE